MVVREISQIREWDKERGGVWCLPGGAHFILILLEAGLLLLPSLMGRRFFSASLTPFSSDFPGVALRSQPAERKAAGQNGGSGGSHPRLAVCLRSLLGPRQVLGIRDAEAVAFVAGNLFSAWFSFSLQVATPRTSLSLLLS